MPKILWNYDNSMFGRVWQALPNHAGYYYNLRKRHEYKNKLCLNEKFGILYKYLQFNAYRIYEEVSVVDIINHIDSASEFSHAE